MRAWGAFLGLGLLAACGHGSGADYQVVGTIKPPLYECNGPVTATGGRALFNGNLIDVSDPASPTLLANPIGGLGAEIVHAEGNEVWLWMWPKLTVLDMSTPSAPVTLNQVDFTDAASEAYALQVAVTDRAVVVVGEIGVPLPRSVLVTYDRATLPVSGAPLPSGLIDLPGRRTDFAQDARANLAVRGDFAIVGGTPNLIAIDVSDPAAPIVTDSLQIPWDVDRNAVKTTDWVGFDGDGDVVTRLGLAGSTLVATTPLSASGALGEPSVNALSSDAPGFGLMAIAGDVLMTAEGLYRLDGPSLDFLGTTPNLGRDGRCGFAADADRFYVQAVNEGLFVVEVP